MNLIGNDLKMIRQHKKFTLLEISQITKIDPERLSSIEDGTIFTRSTENETYIRSFVRSYGKALRLDEALVIEALDQQTLGLYDGELLRDFPELQTPVDARKSFAAVPSTAVRSQTGTTPTQAATSSATAAERATAQPPSTTDASAAPSPATAAERPTAPPPLPARANTPSPSLTSSTTRTPARHAAPSGSNRADETSDSEDAEELIQLHDAPVATSSDKPKFNAPIRPEWDLDEDDLDSLDGDPSFSGQDDPSKRSANRSLNVGDVDWSRLSHQTQSNPKRFTLWMLFTIVAIASAGVLIAVMLDVDIPFVNTSNESPAQTERELAPIGSDPSSLEGTAAYSSSGLSNVVVIPAIEPDQASSGTGVDQQGGASGGTNSTGRGDLQPGTPSSGTPSSGSPLPGASLPSTSDLRGPVSGVPAGEPVEITIYAAYDKLEPVRVWTDMNPERSEPTPYWVEKGDAITIEMRDRLHIQGQYSRMTVFANGQQIVDVTGGFYVPETRRIELTRARLSRLVDLSKRIPMEVPSVQADPDTTTPIASRLRN